MGKPEEAGVGVAGGSGAGAGVVTGAGGTGAGVGVGVGVGVGAGDAVVVGDVVGVAAPVPGVEAVLPPPFILFPARELNPAPQANVPIVRQITIRPITLGRMVVFIGTPGSQR